MRAIYTPAGRLLELQTHPNADRMAYQAGRGIFDNYTVKTWTNRPAMLQACRMSDTGSLENAGRVWRPLIRKPQGE